MKKPSKSNVSNKTVVSLFGSTTFYDSRWFVGLSFRADCAQTVSARLLGLRALLAYGRTQKRERKHIAKASGHKQQ